MLYRILRDLGSIDPTRRQAAIRMARGLPWEDLEQFLSFFDKAQADAIKSMWTVIAILLVVGSGTVLLFQKEIKKLQPLALAPAACAVVLLPVPVWLSYSSSRRRAALGLTTILNEMDDAAFVPVATGMLSESHADHYSFRNEMLKAVARLLPEVTLEQCRDWTPEERYTLSHALHTVLPVSAGGRDALSHSPSDTAMVTLKVLQRIGDAREIELIRLISTIDPLTEKHQAVREASVKCLKSIDMRIADAPPGSGIQVQPTNRVATTNSGVRGRVASRTEVDLGHLLKVKPRVRSGSPDV